MQAVTKTLLLTLLALPLVARGQSSPERALFQLANQSRAQYGLPPLRWDQALANSARMHLAWIVQESSLEHQYRGEPDLLARASHAGALFTTVAENLATRGTSPVQLHQVWMASPGHRANLLDPQLNALGVAVVSVHGLLYAVEDFSRAVPSLTREGIESQISELLVRYGVALGSSNIDAQRTCESPHGDFGDPRVVIQWDGPDPTTPPPILHRDIATGQYTIATIAACRGQQPGNRDFVTWHVAVLLY